MSAYPISAFKSVRVFFQNHLNLRLLGRQGRRLKTAEVPNLDAGHDADYAGEEVAEDEQDQVRRVCQEPVRPYRAGRSVP